VEDSGRQWETSGRSGRRAEVSGRPGRGRKGSGRPWEQAEEAGRLGKVTVRYRQATNQIPSIYQYVSRQWAKAGRLLTSLTSTHRGL